MNRAATRATAPTTASRRSPAFLGRSLIRFSVPLLIISRPTLLRRNAGGVRERSPEGTQRASRPVDHDFPGALHGAGHPTRWARWSFSTVIEVRISSLLSGADQRQRP